MIENFDILIIFLNFFHDYEKYLTKIYQINPRKNNFDKEIIDFDQFLKKFRLRRWKTSIIPNMLGKRST